MFRIQKRHFGTPPVCKGRRVGTALGLHNIGFVFLLLMTGMGMSLTLFLCEQAKCEFSSKQAGAELCKAQRSAKLRSKLSSEIS